MRWLAADKALTRGSNAAFGAKGLTLSGPQQHDLQTAVLQRQSQDAADHTGTDDDHVCL
jgi:hypothetical protein